MGTLENCIDLARLEADFEEVGLFSIILTIVVALVTIVAAVFAVRTYWFAVDQQEELEEEERQRREDCIRSTTLEYASRWRDCAVMFPGIDNELQDVCYRCMFSQLLANRDRCRRGESPLSYGCW